MKSIKVCLFILISLFIGFMCDSNVYAADATCIYEGTTVTYTFSVNSNNNGGVDYELTHKKNNANDRLTYYVTNKEIASNNFINNSTNKIVCPDNLYFKISGGNSTNVSVTLSFSKFNGAAVNPITLSDKSTNSNVDLDANNAIIKSCSYNGKNIINGNIVSKVYINLTKNGLSFEATNGYTVATVDETKINTSTFTKDTQCSDFTVHVTCGNSGNNKYCTIAKDDVVRPGTGTSGTETPDAEDLGSQYTCTYKGQINGKTMKISKYADEWKVTYPDGNVRNFKQNQVGGNLFPTSNCEDIFYAPDEKAIKKVDANTKFTKDYVIQWCRMYDDVEQYCSGDDCKINNPYCGADLSVEDYGSCPEEIRPIIWFIKKLVFNTLKIFVPILLIIMGTIDLIKAMSASGSNIEKSGNEAIGRFIRRALTAVLIFFVVTIVSVVIDMFAKTDVGKKDDWKACWYNID